MTKKKVELVEATDLTRYHMPIDQYVYWNTMEYINSKRIYKGSEHKIRMRTVYNKIVSVDPSIKEELDYLLERVYKCGMSNQEDNMNSDF